MGKYFISGETVRVNFPDGEWVDVKEELSQADTDYILSKMMKRVTNDGDKPAFEMELGKQATLERAIVAWSFADERKAIPVTPENISNLRSKYRTAVLKQIDALDKQAGAFAKN